MGERQADSEAMRFIALLGEGGCVFCDARLEKRWQERGADEVGWARDYGFILLKRLCKGLYRKKSCFGFWVEREGVEGWATKIEAGSIGI